MNKIMIFMRVKKIAISKKRYYMKLIFFEPHRKSRSTRLLNGFSVPAPVCLKDLPVVPFYYSGH